MGVDFKKRPAWGAPLSPSQKSPELFSLAQKGYLPYFFALIPTNDPALYLVDLLMKGL